MADFYRYPPLEAPDVEVLVDGTWHGGVAEARRADGDRWLWFVRWSTAVGENRLGWYDQEQLRLVSSGADGAASSTPPGRAPGSGTAPG